MSPSLPVAVLGAAVLWAAAADAGEPFRDSGRQTAIRGQSPEGDLCEDDCDCESCRDDEGLLDKMGALIDFCCMKHRWFRQKFPYQSCYKPCPPYRLDNKGYFTTCWRRLPVTFRPCPPVIVGVPVGPEPPPFDIKPEFPPEPAFPPASAPTGVLPPPPLAE